MSDTAPPPPNTAPVRAIIVIWLSIVLILGLIWLLANYPSNPTERPLADGCETIAQGQSHTSDNQNRPSETTPTVVPTEPSVGQRTSDTEEEHRANERRLAQYTCELAIYTAQLAAFTKWLVVVTVAVAVVGIWQGFQLSRHAGHMENMAVTARDTAHHQLRAYVFFDGGSMRLLDANGNDLVVAGLGGPGLTGNGLVEVVAIFKNVGQTPAYEFKLWRKVAILDTQNPDFGDIGERIDMDVIGPDVEVPIVARTPITQAQLREIMRKQKAIFSWGRIDYVDQFGREQFYEFYHNNGQWMRQRNGWAVEPSSGKYKASR